MSEVPFYQTNAGRKFFEGHVPCIAASLKKIAKEMEEANQLKKIEMGIVPKLTDVAKEFMRERA